MQSDAVSNHLAANPDGVYEAIEALTRVLIEQVAPTVLDTGWALYWALAIIIVVWTGLKQAFSGDLRVWDYWTMLFSLGVPAAMLQFYNTPIQFTPGVPLTLPGSGNTVTFPELVVAQGSWLATTITDTAQEDFFEFVRGLWSQIAQSLFTANADGQEPLDWTMYINPVAWIGSIGTSAVVLFVSLVAFFATLLAAIVGFAQVLFAQVAISICVLLGPMLIPWILIDRMAFLFWGWFKSLITYSLYAAIAAAVFRVMLALLEGTVGRVLEEVQISALLRHDPSSNDTLLALAGALGWLLMLVIVAVSALLAFFQIPSIAGGLVSGQAGGGSMLGALATGAAAVTGAGKVAGAAAKGGAKPTG